MHEQVAARACRLSVTKLILFLTKLDRKVPLDQMIPTQVKASSIGFPISDYNVMENTKVSKTRSSRKNCKVFFSREL